MGSIPSAATTFEVFTLSGQVIARRPEDRAMPRMRLRAAAAALLLGLSMPATAVAAIRIECGQTLRGTLDSTAAIDAYIFDGSAGDAVLTAAVSPGPSVAIADLYDPAGLLLASNQPGDSTTPSLALAITGTYTIRVRTLSGAPPVDYAVNLQFTTGRCGAGLPGGNTASQQLLDAEQDSYLVCGLGNAAVSLSVRRLPGPAVPDPFPMADLYDPAGALLATTTFTPVDVVLPREGIYTIIVRNTGLEDGIGVHRYEVGLTGTTCAAPAAPVLQHATPPPPTGALVTLTGEAIDGDGTIESVWWSTDRGYEGQGSGTSRWYLSEIPLLVGDNRITITARDDDGRTGFIERVFTLTTYSYHLAEGATGSFFDTDLLLANPNSRPAPITVSYLKPGGVAPIVVSDTLPANSRTTRRLDQIAGLEDTAVSTVVTSMEGLPLIVERTMRWDATGYGSHTEKAVSGRAQAWYFAEGAQGFFSTYLLLSNPESQRATATVDWLREGESPLRRSYDVPPRSRTTIDAGADPALVNRSFGIVVSGFGGVVERAMYFGAQPGRLWPAGHASAGVNAPSTSWFIAEGATGTFFETFLLLANPNPAAATVTVTFLRDSGVPIVRAVTLPANGRATLNVEQFDPGLADTAIAARIESTLPIVAERSQYWPDPAAAWSEAHNAFGVTRPGVRWGLGEGRVGGPEHHQTYILLANPGQEPANVVITFLRETGSPVVKVFFVPAGRRFNVRVTGEGSHVPELADTSFGALITADQPIVVERAMYSDAGGAVWAAGTSATATRLP